LSDPGARRADSRSGALFALGSACFAAASIASQWASAPRPWIGVTFFAGSLFFTGGGWVQYRGAAASPRRADRFAALVQLAGTLLFNLSTFAAMRHGLTTRQADLRVWTPDVAGSICFLVASAVAYAVVCGRRICVRLRDGPWRIAALNLVGSIAFGASAVASLIQPSTNEPVSAAVANATTTAGALCFLAGALLLRAAALRGGAGRARGRREAPALRRARP
jgi:YrhK-like protein